MSTARTRLTGVPDRGASETRSDAYQDPTSEPGAANQQDELDALGEVLRRERIYRRLLALADAVAVLLALFATMFLTGMQVSWIAVAAIPLVILVAKVQGLYDRDELVIFKSTLGELPRLIQVAAITSVALDFIHEAVRRDHTYGLVFSLILCVTMTAAMLVARGLARNAARRTAPEERCLIIGDGASCADLGRKIDEVRGVSLLGAVSIGDIGDLAQDLRDLVQTLGAQRLVVAPSNRTPDNQTLDLVRHAKATGARVSIFPTIMAAVGGSVVFDDFAGYTLLGVPRFGLSRSSAAVKRGFDFIGTMVALIVLSPLILIAAITIKLESPGPVIFRQVRVGRDGQRFSMLKFRSMVDGADAMKKDLMRRNEAESGLFKIAQDPRVTRTGRWLRQSRLDELPQLFNVLRGEMSLVGPRPLILEEDERVVGMDRRRLHLTPGMTGPWQVLGPMRVPLTEMAKLDYLYIANWSLWRDIEILLKTVGLVFRQSGV